MPAVAIEEYEHCCLNGTECGELISQTGHIKTMRKYIVTLDGKKISPKFETREKALACVKRLGLEIS